LKIKAIASICAQEKIARLIDKTGDDGTTNQWAGGHGCLYALPGIPYMGERNVLSVFDIPEEKRAKIEVRHEDAEKLNGIVLDDISDVEKPLVKTSLLIGRKGSLYQPLLRQHNLGITFVDTRYLAPLDDPLNIEMYERPLPSGAYYIAVKAGFLLLAVITHAAIATNSLTETLESIAARCRMTLDFDQITITQEERGEQK